MRPPASFMLNMLERNSSQIYKISSQAMSLLVWNLSEMVQLVDGESSLGQLILKKQERKRQIQLEHCLELMGPRMLFTVVIAPNLLRENQTFSSVDKLHLDQCKQLLSWIIAHSASSNHILSETDNLVKLLI